MGLSGSAFIKSASSISRKLIINDDCVGLKTDASTPADVEWQHCGGGV